MCKHVFAKSNITQRWRGKGRKGKTYKTSRCNMQKKKKKKNDVTCTLPTHKRIVALRVHTCTISCTISTGSSSQFTGMTLNWVSVCFVVETFQFLPWYLHSNRNHCPALAASILRPGTSGQAAVSKENAKGILWECGSLRLWSHIKTTMDPRKPIHHCERQLFPPLFPFSWTYAYLYTETRL